MTAKVPTPATHSEEQETPTLPSSPLPPEAWLALLTPMWEQEDR